MGGSDTPCTKASSSVSMPASSPTPAPPAFADAVMASHASGEAALQPQLYPLKVGAHSIQGYKEHISNWVNQDRQLVVPLGPGRVFAGVFDGHGEHGHNVAALVCEIFRTNAPNLPGLDNPLLPEALAYLFGFAHETVDQTGMADWSGTTATVALVDAALGTACTAHVGDSRAVVANQRRVEFETQDHVVDDAAEQRILANGGEVHCRTISGITARRVFLKDSEMPALSMSRAIGDCQAHAVGVLCEPVVHSGIELRPGQILVLASDGIWEHMSAEETTSAIRHTDPESAARQIVEMARSRWPAEGDGDVDDITAVVVGFDSERRFA